MCLNDVRTRISKYVSYLLRHSPEDLNMDERGFVHLDDLASKVKARYPAADRRLLTEITYKSDKKRFEIVGEKIRALYGHSIDAELDLAEDSHASVLYHGTTPEAACMILKNGLSPMGRKWVHLSPTKEIAYEVGRRRASNPTILSVDALKAREDGVRFYRATEKVYLCQHVPAKYVRAVG